MSHIAVERNRRRQMNEHLKVLRSLTPAFYIKRGDQASIIGGAIDFIKELQTLLQSLEAQKKRRLQQQQQHISPAGGSPSPTPSPRSLITTCSPTGFSSSGGSSAGSSAAVIDISPTLTPKDSNKPAPQLVAELAACCNSPMADVEARISGANVLLRTLSRRAQLPAVRIIALLETLHLEVLHLNITSMDDTVLYSFVLKIGLDCHLSVDDLAMEVHQTFCDPPPPAPALLHPHPHHHLHSI
ncbi:transcription factor MUTE [Oryza brachyantha]|uniref:BHLH domain-containing protein n=1 Tax=Oryza brachyantha TaxID=4533 RepID=J3MAF1_ORYBR|nr:transcription factor MUTE [Oryza brachyantha]